MSHDRDMTKIRTEEIGGLEERLSAVGDAVLTLCEAVAYDVAQAVPREGHNEKRNTLSKHSDAVQRKKMIIQRQVREWREAEAKDAKRNEEC